MMFSAYEKLIVKTYRRGDDAFLQVLLADKTARLGPVHDKHRTILSGGIKIITGDRRRCIVAGPMFREIHFPNFFPRFGGNGDNGTPVTEHQCIGPVGCGRGDKATVLVRFPKAVALGDITCS
jgi:hypothetical protein